MAIEVCIKLDDQGNYSVGIESEPVKPMGMPGDEMAMQGEATETEGGSNMQPARDLNEALMMAGKLLSQKPEQGSSPFDEGLKKVLPQRQGIM